MKLIQDMKVLASATDFTARVGLVGSIAFLQDNMCDFFKNLGCDGITMIPKCNAFFVISKTKIKFIKQPKWNDEISLQTGVFDVSKIRVNLINNIYFRSGEIAVCGIQELCPIDSDTRRLRSVESTLFPADIEVILDDKNIDYSKLNFDKNLFELKKSIIINLSNVDYYLHTNNVEYVRFCLSVLDEKIFEDKDLDEFEIHYIKECRIGEMLDVFTRIEDNNIEFMMMSGDNIVVKAKLLLKTKTNV